MTGLVFAGLYGPSDAGKGAAPGRQRRSVDALLFVRRLADRMAQNVKEVLEGVIGTLQSRIRLSQQKQKTEQFVLLLAACVSVVGTARE